MRLVDVGVNSGQAYEFMSNFNCLSRTNILQLLRCGLFILQECGHGWTSMKGRVIFWFQLNYATNMGYVMFKLYGQQCQRCKNGKYEHAMWYPEEVIKVSFMNIQETRFKGLRDTKYNVL